MTRRLDPHDGWTPQVQEQENPDDPFASNDQDEWAVHTPAMTRDETPRDPLREALEARLPVKDTPSRSESGVDVMLAVHLGTRTDLIDSIVEIVQHLASSLDEHLWPRPAVSAPETEAGRLLADEVAELADSADVSIWNDGSDVLEHFAGRIVAIEAEAIATERARIIAAVTALDPHFIGGYGSAISDVLAIIEPPERKA